LAHVLGVTSQISQNKSNPAAWTELAHHLVHYRDSQNNANLIAQGKHPPHHTALWTLTGWAHVGALASQFPKNWKTPSAWTEVFHHAMHAMSGMDAVFRNGVMGKFFSNPLWSQLSAVGALGHSVAILSQIGKNWKNPAVWTDLILHLVEVRDFKDLLKPLLGPLAETNIMIWMMLVAAGVSITLAQVSKEQDEAKTPDAPEESVLDAIDLMNRSQNALAEQPAMAVLAQNAASARFASQAVIPEPRLSGDPILSSRVTGPYSIDAAYVPFWDAQGHSTPQARRALDKNLSQIENKLVQGE